MTFIEIVIHRKLTDLTYNGIPHRRPETHTPKSLSSLQPLLLSRTDLTVT